MLYVITLTLMTSLDVLGQGAGPCKRVVCYMTNWSQFRQFPATFIPRDIDPDKCTHVVYAYAQLEEHNMTNTELNDNNDAEYRQGFYTLVNNLKATHPGLKTLLALSGYDPELSTFKNFGNNRMNLQREFQSIVNFLRKYKFDGLDVLWPQLYELQPENPNWYRFSDYIKDLAEAFQADAKSTGKTRLLLAVTAPMLKETTFFIREGVSISSALDMITIMSYDYHGAFGDVLGYIGLNARLSANKWTAGGFPADKINIALAAYGRKVALEDSKKPNFERYIFSHGPGGRYEGWTGTLCYYEVCKELKGKGYVYRDQMTEVPYYVDSKNWIGYDDPRSVIQKVKYIKQKGFGGVALWNIDMDDFKGRTCGQGKYPLLSAIFNECQLQ